LKKIIEYLGIDKAIVFTVLSRGIQALGSVVNILLIALFLNSEEQGYFYTFMSIVALQVFFELGFNSIIVQYVAHEMAALKWKNCYQLVGEAVNISRVASLLRFVVKLFSILTIFVFVILCVSGLMFFSKYGTKNSDVFWIYPWVLISFATSVLFFVNPFLAFLEGLGKVKDIAKLRFFQQTVNVGVVCIVFFCGGKLWALGISTLLSILVVIFCLFKFNLYRYLYSIIRESISEKISYRNEIFPYQWRIALSWISGYFIFQLFSPVLFATEGAKIAGQMGMTLTALNGISTLSMSWISTKVPMYSSFIALNDFEALDKSFNKTMKQLLVVNLSFIALFILGLIFFKMNSISLIDRFLPVTYVLLLSIITVINQFVFSWATYLRCHKKEPLLIYSIVIGVLVASSTIGLGKYFGLVGIVVGYFMVSVLVGLPWAFYIYVIKKKEWHV
jgi:O-antigen/teichoic acid export membrane protein